MIEPRIFRTPAGYQATIRLERNGTWTLLVDSFYEGEAWTIDDRDVYEGLSLSECADCLLGELFTARP